MSAFTIGWSVRQNFRGLYVPVVANQPGDCGVRRGAEVVRIRHRGIAVSQRQKAIQHSRCGEGGVEITVPRWTPLQILISRPRDRCQVVGLLLGS